MKRNEARALWQRIAEGELGDVEPADAVDLHAWIQEVAKRLVEADDEPAGARPGAIARAAGLAGQDDGYAELRRLLDAVDGFDALDEKGEPSPRTSGQVTVDLVALARSVGLLVGVYEIDDKKAAELIRAIRDKRI
jgi:hypothetical protein